MIGSFVALIFFIKWCIIKNDISRISSYLQVFYEKSMRRGKDCTWESDCLLFDQDKKKVHSFQNGFLYLSWIILGFVPFLVSLGLYLLKIIDLREIELI